MRPASATLLIRRSGSVGQGAVDARDEAHRVACAILELLGPQQDLGLGVDDEDARQSPLDDSGLLGFELVAVPEFQRRVEGRARSVEVTATSDLAVCRLAQSAVRGATHPAEHVLQLTAQGAVRVVDPHQPSRHETIMDQTGGGRVTAEQIASPRLATVPAKRGPDRQPEVPSAGDLGYPGRGAVT